MNVILTETIREKHARGVGARCQGGSNSSARKILEKLARARRSLLFPERLALPGCTRAGECTQRLNAGEN